MAPKFAVIIPTHNRPQLVIQAVDSVLGQTYPATEIIVIVDGPDPRVTDGLGDRQVTVIEQVQSGEAGARNTGLNRAATEWVCFLDDDDLWHPEHLAKFAELIAGDPTIEAAQAMSWTFASDPDVHADLLATTLPQCLAASSLSHVAHDMTYLNITGRSFDLLLERNRGNIGTAVVKRERLIQAGGFPEGYTCAADWVMFIDVARFVEWAFIPERLTFTRLHGGNNTQTGALTNGLATIMAIRGVWGEKEKPTPHHRPLREYGADYRHVVQGAIWKPVRRGKMRLALQGLRSGWVLLPNLADRLYVLVPPPISWRVQRIRGAWNLRSAR